MKKILGFAVVVFAFVGVSQATQAPVPVPEPSMAFLLIPALGFVGVIRKKFMV